jgi:hypothetical protein
MIVICAVVGLILLGLIYWKYFATPDPVYPPNYYPPQGPPPPAAPAQRSDADGGDSNDED